jgi:inositol polyphosphate 5-phosphatase INPP5B/F
MDYSSNGCEVCLVRCLQWFCLLLLFHRALEYSDLTKIIICCGTWNVNAKTLPEEYDISSWLSLPETPLADIYGISLQEMVDLNVMNVVLIGSQSEDSTNNWTQKILDTLNKLSGDQYTFICQKHMVGLYGGIFVKKSLSRFISDVRAASVYTGGYGTTGNKGGIAIRFDLLDSGFCFVAAHFHANRDNIQQRNQDFHNIWDGISFPPNSHRNSYNNSASIATTTTIGTSTTALSTGSTTAPTSSPSSSSSSSSSLHTLGTYTSRPNSLSFHHYKSHLTLTIESHEQIFWLGDLNYRIGGNYDDFDIFQLVEKSEWPQLIQYDQLITEQKQNNIFVGFEEGKIIFPPTYKFQPNTSHYEQRPDKKLRAPPWCDRILWKSNQYIKESMKQLAYLTHLSLLVSDHRPVSAWFEGYARKIVPDQMRHVYQELLFSVDKWINASTPKLTIDNRVFEFGSILLEVRCFFLSFFLSFFINKNSHMNNNLLFFRQNIELS